MSTATRKVPSSALCLTAGALTFAAPAEGEDSKRAPLKMRARSGQPINHWYWGNVVHDMDGFRAIKPVLTADYCHNPEEVLGFLNEFDPKPDGLDVSGELIAFEETDRSAEVLFKGRAGVPYEASIYFVPEAIEEILPGGSAKVNGYELAGPALIIRKWALRGVAVCPYGYDPRTSSQFSAPGVAGGDIDVPYFSLPTELAAMSVNPNSAPANPPAAPPAAAAQLAATQPPAAPPVDGRDAFKAELQRYVAKFGADNGAKWYSDGKSWEQALELHADALVEANKATAAESVELKAKLAAMPRGEAAPAAFSEGSQATGAANPLAVKLGANLGAYASSIKLPGLTK